jgi:hypothetical protein
VDGVYLIEGFLHGGRAHDVSVDPDGEEDGVHAAFSHAGNIHVTFGVALAEIVILREEALRRIIVCVQDDGGEVQLMCALGNFINGDSSGQDRCDQATNGRQNDNAAAAHFSSTQIMLHESRLGVRWHDLMRSLPDKGAYETSATSTDRGR